MHAIMSNPQFNLPVIVNMDSTLFAELSCAGYVPIATGYKKQLETMEEEMMQDFVSDLEMNADIN